MMGDTGKKANFAHLVGAALICIVVFLFCLYIIAPIATTALDWFGRHFVPARYGGGSEIDNAGILEIIKRSVIVLGFSAFLSYISAKHFFPDVKNSHLSATIVAILSISGGLFLFWGYRPDIKTKLPAKTVSYHIPMPAPLPVPMSAPIVPGSARGADLHSARPQVLQKTPDAPVEIHLPLVGTKIARIEVKPIRKVVFTDGSWMECRDAARCGNAVSVETINRDIIKFKKYEVDIKRTFAKR